MKISRSGLFCLALLCTGTCTFRLARAQAAEEPAGQAPAQAPAQTPATAPAPQQPAPAQQTPPENTTPPESRPLKLPPTPPKVIDVRMPGEAGWNIGVIGWLPIGPMWVDKGHAAFFTDPTKLQFAGGARQSVGAEFGVAAGLHNSVRFTYFSTKRSGTTTAAQTLTIFSQEYAQGDQLSTNGTLSDYKLSYEFLTLPYPVEARHFRLKTLWQVHYINMKSSFDAPILSSTPDSNGTFTSYVALGSKNFFTPALGLGVHEYANRNFRLEANISGFALPHRFQLVDSDAAIAYRAGHLEFRVGGKAFLFRTSPKQDYFFRGTVGGAFVGVRWYSD